MRDAKRKLPSERREELLARAVEISHADGLAAVTLRRVGADLGVTPGLVSHYFSSADQLIAAAFRTAALADLDAARTHVGTASRPTARLEALLDYVLGDVSEIASALWLDAWSLGRRNPTLAAEVPALTDAWLTLIGEILRAGRDAGEFEVSDVEASARRLLILIDGLGAQKVTRDATGNEIAHIARSYVASELPSAHQPSVSTRSSAAT
ncbi:HTH-type transcriptional regulator BetI [Mycolicibacterium madagascariense]|uniref:HTH-type transcriptional regulator BetI n=1 Tax=Mycolicibacterium madagascariense TaxID=212765 RepID=A0A7I7XL57_9MYCO|nr:TetR family transcriptional regulator C-terminal domain-containing protein [Mycolicibacterium madagascariense]MCV7013219.1 TetR/AcrR family transcriptional regulator [Mycolicibacterium madagascariense]BBZ29961.1 HTH-type transcriptional regulator BetI [Mycolicibacterium madagascariense]